MKETTILINGEPFTYLDEIDDITYENVDAISEEDARTLLQVTKKLFNECGLDFYLAYGTLLGAVRDHGLIKGDEDVDVYVESEEKLRNSLPFLSKNGLKVCRIFEHRLYSFHTDNKSYIDVYIKGKLPFSIWRLWCDRLSSVAVPKRYVNKHDKIMFLGVECLCPHKPERLLRFWYGKNWRTPIRGHSFSYDVPSRVIWKTKIKPYYHKTMHRLKLTITNPILYVKKKWSQLHH